MRPCRDMPEYCLKIGRSEGQVVCGMVVMTRIKPYNGAPTSCCLGNDFVFPLWDFRHDRLDLILIPCVAVCRHL